MALAQKQKGYKNTPGVNEGQMKGNAQADKFADPMADSKGYQTDIIGMGGHTARNEGGEMVGFQTEGYIDKGGTPYGEAAKFNFLPPGMDISDQENAEIHNMPMKRLINESYPGDGWGSDRDIPE